MKIKVKKDVMFKPEEIKRVKELTKKTSEELYNKALKQTGGDEKKAISLLFNPSSELNKIKEEK